MVMLLPIRAYSIVSLLSCWNNLFYFGICTSLDLNIMVFFFLLLFYFMIYIVIFVYFQLQMSYQWRSWRN